MSRIQITAQREVMRLLRDQKNQDPQIMAQFFERIKLKDIKEDRVLKAIGLFRDKTKPMPARLAALNTVIDAFKGEL